MANGAVVVQKLFIKLSAVQVLMAILAGHCAVGTLEHEVCRAVVEGLHTEPHDVCITALVLRMARATLGPPHGIREAMEALLFNLLWRGFILLTLTLVSGVFFTEQIFGKAFVINHHIVLSASAWLVFGIFLFGHWRWGWRGKNALHWTIGGLSLLILGYFGTKFVLEFMLDK